MKFVKYRAVLIVGATHSGKTTYGKKILDAWKGRKYIFDVNNEHKGGVIMDSSEFIDRASTLKNTMIYIEESTIFFSNKGDNMKLKMLLVKKRHDKNIIVMVFHSLQAIPAYILTLTDAIVLFKTNDNARLVNTKYKGFDEIINGFVEISKKATLYEPEVIILGAGIK